MAMMEPVRGLSQFVAVLADLRDGARSPYPFYCALLYTVAEGIDAELAAYVDANWDELDAMTGDRGLVFVVGDVRDEPVAGHRAFSPAEVYAIAGHLGVRSSALPCAAFFTRPAASRDVLRLRLADYLPAERTAPALTGAFRGIASALDRCAALPGDADRLDCLRSELIRERELWLGGPSATERLESAASAAGSMEKVVVSGATILTTVLGILGGG